MSASAAHNSAGNRQPRIARQKARQKIRHCAEHGAQGGQRRRIQAQRDEQIAARAEAAAEPDEGERLHEHALHLALTDEHAQRQHAAEEQDDERGARQPPPRGQGQQHGQRARHHGGVQRGVERSVQRRAENGVRRPFRQKAGLRPAEEAAAG